MINKSYPGTSYYSVTSCNYPDPADGEDHYHHNNAYAQSSNGI